jgi:hypothetical protein
MRGRSLAGLRISPPSTVVPRMTPERIRKVPVVRSGSHERVALLPGVLTGQSGQLHAETVRIDLKAVEVSLGDLHHEIVRHQGAALRHDRGPVIHLALYRAGNLHRLQLGFERPREGTLDHALEPALEATENSHRGTSFPYPHPMVSALRELLRTC